MADFPALPAVEPPVLGRPSPAATAPARLRDRPSGAPSDFRADGGDSDRLAVRAASVAGVRHRLAGRGVEDDYGWRVGGGWVLAAVADGVGSTPGAATAAATALTAALEAGASTLDSGVGQAWPGGPPWPDEPPPGLFGGGDGPSAAVGGPADLEAAVDAAVSAAARRLAEARDGGGSGATTLVVMAVDDDGRWRAARVGDSSAFLLEGGEWREVFSGVDDDDAMTTATRALPAADVVVERTGGTAPEGCVVVMATDGVAEPLRDGPETVAPALAGALADPPSPLTLLAVTDFARQGCHDDRTILAIWRLAGGREG